MNMVNINMWCACTHMPICAQIKYYSNNRCIQIRWPQMWLQARKKCVLRRDLKTLMTGQSWWDGAGYSRAWGAADAKARSQRAVASVHSKQCCSNPQLHCTHMGHYSSLTAVLNTPNGHNSETTTAVLQQCFITQRPLLWSAQQNPIMTVWLTS